MQRFTTEHRPRDHRALKPDGSVLVESQPTEVDLVRGLADLGVNLKNYGYSSTGDMGFLVVEWYYSPTSNHAKS